MFFLGPETISFSPASCRTWSPLVEFLCKPRTPGSWMLHRCPSSVWLPHRRCCLAVFSKPLTSFTSRKGCCRSVKLRRKGTCRPSRRAQALAALSILVCASPRSYAAVSAASICCFPDDQMYHRSIPACRHPAESSSPPSLLGSSLWIHSR